MTNRRHAPANVANKILINQGATESAVTFSDFPHSTCSNAEAVLRVDRFTTDVTGLPDKTALRKL